MGLFSQEVMRIWVETSQEYRLGREIQVFSSAWLERHKGREEGMDYRLSPSAWDSSGRHNLLCT